MARNTKILDLDEYRSSYHKEKFIEEFGNALVERGYVLLVNNRIPGLCDIYYKKLSELFRLPSSQLLRYKLIEYGLEGGYIPPKDPSSLMNLEHRKMSWTIAAGVNMYPRAIKRLGELSQRLYEVMYETGVVAADSLSYYFLKYAQNGSVVSKRFTSVMKGYHGYLVSFEYPAVRRREIERLRVKSPFELSDEHADSSMFTILPKGSRGGLLVNDGEKYREVFKHVANRSNILAVMAGTGLSKITRGLRGFSNRPLYINAPFHKVVSTKAALSNPRHIAIMFTEPRLTSTLVSLRDGKPIPVTLPFSKVTNNSSPLRACYPIDLPKKKGFYPLKDGDPIAQRYLTQRRVWQLGISYREFRENVLHSRDRVMQVVKKYKLDVSVK